MYDVNDVIVKGTGSNEWSPIEQGVVWSPVIEIIYSFFKNNNIIVIYVNW
jgi:hypothetical protein